MDIFSVCKIGKGSVVVQRRRQAWLIPALTRHFFGGGGGGWGVFFHPFFILGFAKEKREENLLAEKAQN